VCDSLNRRRNRQGQRLRNPPAAYVTGLLVPRGSAIKVDQQVRGIAVAGTKLEHISSYNTLALSSAPGLHVTRPQGRCTRLKGGYWLCLQALQLLGVRHVLEVESVADGASGVLYDEGDLVRAIEVMLKLMSSERSSDSTFQQPPEIPAAVASVDSA
jgi:hypothetical protein